MWARVSTEMQEEKGLSLPEQLREMRAYAEKQDIEILAEFSEAASAFQKKVRRVEFERMIEAAKSDRNVTAILVHDLSRFSRDSLEAKILTRDLSRAGVRVISLSDPYIDPESVAGVYMEAITFAKNEAYSREIAFHTKKGCRSNIQTRDSETGWCYKNGGQPLWGYRSERLVRGELKKGRPLIKSIWVPDDRIVSGKPVHEWARYCLISLAMNGATLDDLRDFCNEHGIPAPRQQYWGSTTWHSLLHPHSLLQYAGYGVWNVRGKNQRWNPPSEWVIVPDAHPALISEEEALAIIELRKQRGPMRPKESGAKARSKGSRYMLSGGLFKCDRCGSNMAGFTSTNGKGRKGDYYVCGSAQYRRSLGCGPGVYVDKQVIEEAVLNGVIDRFTEWGDPVRFTCMVNRILCDLQKESTVDAVEIRREISELDGKMDNVRRAIEDGLRDVDWANTRLRDLSYRRDELVSKQAQTQEVTALPKLDTSIVREYQKQFGELMKYGTAQECRQLIACFVESVGLRPSEMGEIKTEPVAHEITINFKAMPALFVKGLGAGVGFEPTTFGL
ncbi:MAG: recombinase family protein [Armatimonadota bacterium]